MPETKRCEFCQQCFEKPYSCGRPEWLTRRFCSRACKIASQVGQPSARKGKHYGSTAAKLPCRICGRPTKYNTAQHRKAADMVHCDDSTCIAASRMLKNARIAQRARTMYATGERQRIRSTWKNVRRISPEEESLAPWFSAHGWVSQHKILTGVGGNQHTPQGKRLPAMFRLDFALPAYKLYVEIDGHVHRLRKERDAQRDIILTSLGWQGLRIPAQTVRTDIQRVQQDIATWATQHLPCGIMLTPAEADTPGIVALFTQRF